MKRNVITTITAALASYPGTTVARVDDSTLDVRLDNGGSFKVVLDELDGDEGDPIGHEPMSPGYRRPDLITDHGTLLDAMLYALADSPHRHHITGLTTDGDGSDCEAIFNFHTVPTVLKVR